eukprot:gene46549-56999_t
MHYPRPRLALSSFAVAALLATAPALRAQVAPASSSASTRSTASDKEIVQLNVFQVTAESDDEYRAANTTTGTRYNTPIKDLPMNIEVLTSAFMRDIGALDIRDALEYVSGIQLDTTAGGVGGSRDNPENTTLLIRGISAGMKKDGFARFIPMDPITMSRVDISKGPGGALYGQNGTGGVVNVSSVQAGSKPVARFGTTIGSFGFRRAELLVSGPVIPRVLGFALPLSYQTTKSNALYYQMDTFVMNPTATLKLGPKTQFLASIES